MRHADVRVQVGGCIAAKPVLAGYITNNIAGFEFPTGTRIVKARRSHTL
jgi:hypothetical protein